MARLTTLGVIIALAASSDDRNKENIPPPPTAPAQTTSSNSLISGIPGYDFYPPLTAHEFTELTYQVTTIDEFEEFFREFPIEYPQKETCQYDFAYSTLYGSPLDTFNLRFGVCDEQSMVRLPFLINIKKAGQLKSIYLIEFKPEHPPDEIQGITAELPVGHAVTIFEDIHGLWGHTDNDDLIKPSLESKMTVLDIINTHLRYDYVRVWETEITTLGRWMDDSTQSIFLRPKVLITTYQNTPRCPPLLQE